MRVGLPRALLFHHYGDSWTSFLKGFGVEPVVSAKTTGQTVVTGASIADNEACLPVKVFTGHLMGLKDKTDSILVPRVVSQNRGMKSCPKYLGLPDIARALREDLPPVLSPTMDLTDRRKRWAREWYRMALDLGASDGAASAAVKKMLQLLSPESQEDSADTRHGFPVGVAGHLYNIHDQRVSLDLLDRVRAMGADPRFKIITFDAPREAPFEFYRNMRPILAGTRIDRRANCKDGYANSPRGSDGSCLE